MLPSILVPLVGLVFPAIAMTAIFIYIEKQSQLVWLNNKTIFFNSAPKL
jgi:photosystem I reaction center subunit VIII